MWLVLNEKKFNMWLVIAYINNLILCSKKYLVLELHANAVVRVSPKNQEGDSMELQTPKP